MEVLNSMHSATESPERNITAGPLSTAKMDPFFAATDTRADTPPVEVSPYYRSPRVVVFFNNCDTNVGPFQES